MKVAMNEAATPVNATSKRLSLLFSSGRWLRTANRISNNTIIDGIAGAMIVFINLKISICKNLHIKIVYKIADSEKQISSNHANTMKPLWEKKIAIPVQ